MFHPNHAIVTDPAARPRACGENSSSACAPRTPAARNGKRSIGAQISAIKALNATTGRGLEDAATGARAASGQIATAAEVAAEAAAAARELQGSLADLGRALSDFRRGIGNLIATAHAV